MGHSFYRREKLKPDTTGGSQHTPLKGVAARVSAPKKTETKYPRGFSIGIATERFQFWFRFQTVNALQ